jgi:hypothetical protein
MVSDCGKPDWVEMDFVISKIENKRPEKPNKYHERILGKRCGIEYLGPGSYCWLWIEGFRDYESYTRFHTSPVWGTKPFPGGTVIETAHSVYTLTLIGEEENENLPQN